MKNEGNRIILSLGSNKDRERNMGLAVNLLRELFPDIRFSEVIETEPYGSLRGGAPFLNQVAVAFTAFEANEVRHQLKNIEKTIGRRPEDKQQQLVLIDIDLLQWNDTLLKPSDLQMGYVRGLLQSLHV